MEAQAYSQLLGFSEQIARELVFAEAGTDLGLLPINSLVGQIEELLSQSAGPEELMEGARRARGWIDQTFEGAGTFSQPTLDRLAEWAEWWQEAIEASQNGQSIPDFPAEWQNASAAASEQSAAPAVVPDEKPAAAPVQTVESSPAIATLTLNLEQDGELLNEFINESHEHLQNIEQGVLQLEENPEDADTLNSIFRAFHTFKGCAGFLNLTPIQTLAHELESLLDLARQHKLEITPAIINIILKGGDTLKEFAVEIQGQVGGTKPAAPISVPTGELLTTIRKVLGANKESAPAVMPQAAAVAEPARVEVAPGPQGQGPAQHEAAPVAEKRSETRNALTSAVKVDTLKLDSLVDLVGEIVIAQSLVVQNEALGRVQSEQLTRDLAQLGRITKDLQRIVMSLRMVPIRGTFQKMNRLVRDVTAKVGKDVQLVTEGEDTELDRTIVEEISDPLIHMVRNAVDHGIERPEVRVQRGKPAQGTLSLRAFHQGGNIVVEIKDDGQGLDRDRILAKGIEKGLVTPEEQLTEAQIFALILAPGFSTAEKVTDLSGRGVGMDVVRRNIEKLRGKIDIQSTPGQGSTFSIYLPLTLAIIDGLLLGVGDQRYILPTLLVRESFRPTPEMITTVQGRGEMINVRGRLCPLLRLYSLLGIEPASTEPTQSLVMVVEAGNAIRCVLVDRLIGKQEVVIKSLGESFMRNPYVAGAAILGDGRVGLILDPQALVHLEAAPMEVAA